MPTASAVFEMPALRSHVRMPRTPRLGASRVAANRVIFHARCEAAVMEVASQYRVTIRREMYQWLRANCWEGFAAGIQLVDFDRQIGWSYVTAAVDPVLRFTAQTDAAMYRLVWL